MIKTKLLRRALIRYAFSQCQSVVCNCEICRGMCKSPCIPLIHDLKSITLVVGFDNFILREISNTYILLPGYKNLHNVKISSNNFNMWKNNNLDAYCIFYNNGFCKIHEFKSHEARIEIHYGVQRTEYIMRWLDFILNDNKSNNRYYKIIRPMMLELVSSPYSQQYIQTKSYLFKEITL